jgi:hypothetical protein
MGANEEILIAAEKHFITAAGYSLFNKESR